VTQRQSTIALRPQGGVLRRARCRIVTAMTKARQAVGAYGERLVSRHLEAQGLVVLARNWRCAEGEIDLILADGQDVVFCEVKTRRNSVFGVPAEAVGPAKVRRLRRLAARWLTESRMRPREVRFDVASVLLQRRGAALIEHVRAAF
jgi:putative endonuclease